MFLRKLRDRFVGRLLGERKGLSEAKKPAHFQNSLIACPINGFKRQFKDNPASYYEPTWMFSTSDSLFWAWRRVKECFESWFGETDHYPEALRLMRR